MKMITMLRAGLVALMLPLSAASFSAKAAEFSPLQRDEMGQIIKDYLMKHPEELRAALSAMTKHEKDTEQQAQEKFTGDTSSAIYSSKFQSVVGNPNGKTVLVEFFDYNCGYCKRTIDDIAELIKKNPDLKVILKDFPVLGPGSIEAAKVETAVRNQLTGEKFWDFHRTLLLSHGQVGKSQAMDVAKAKGVDMDKLGADMANQEVAAAGIAEVMNIGDRLGMNGTPSFIIGKEVVVGAVGFDTLQEKVSNTAKCGKAEC